MEVVYCINCKSEVELVKLEVGTTLDCDCGCIQRCLGVDSGESRWRVLNPFSFEDRRNK